MMNIDIQKIKKVGRKAQALALTAAVGVSAAAGVALMDSPADDAGDDLDTGVDAPKEVESQIDQNSQKLDTIADTSSQEGANYKLLGC